MPELPEVEVVKRSLKKEINTLTIQKIIINCKKLRYLINKKQFNNIINRKVVNVKRRSKYLMIELNNKQIILVHLGMTGKFFVINSKNEKKKTSFYYNINKNDEKHNHIIFYFNNKIKLIYNDVRKFGFIKIITKNEIKGNNHLSLLGPEPLSKHLNFNYFKKYILNRNRYIKDILMDQKFIAGLGNIYVNEILFLSKINPNKKVIYLKDLEIKKIIKFTKEILITSIRNGGSSIKDFKGVKGKSGTFQQKFNVYSKNGKSCARNGCKGVIRKINISNRSTFFCRSCQK